MLDFEFYPFNDSYIATASEDSEIRLWEIPEEMKEDLITPISTLSGFVLNCIKVYLVMGKK